MIGIVNYRMGNLQSVKNALDYIGVDSRFVNSVEDFSGCTKLILPGVGAFGEAMVQLEDLGLRESLDEYVLERKVPLLGICLGLQLLFDSSQEGGVFNGLGYIKGEVLSLDTDGFGLAVPHMGWNSVEQVNPASRLFKNIPNNVDFYFVHGFYCCASRRADVAAQVRYGLKIDVVVEKDNVFGTQFHPEKSHQNGMQLLKNFQALSC